MSQAGALSLSQSTPSSIYSVNSKSKTTFLNGKFISVFTRFTKTRSKTCSILTKGRTCQSEKRLTEKSLWRTLLRFQLNQLSRLWTSSMLGWSSERWLHRKWMKHPVGPIQFFTSMCIKTDTWRGIVTKLSKYKQDLCLSIWQEVKELEGPHQKESDLKKPSTSMQVSALLEMLFRVLQTIQTRESS